MKKLFVLMMAFVLVGTTFASIPFDEYGRNQGSIGYDYYGDVELDGLYCETNKENVVIEWGGDNNYEYTHKYGEIIVYESMCDEYGECIYSKQPWELFFGEGEMEYEEKLLKKVFDISTMTIEDEEIDDRDVVTISNFKLVHIQDMDSVFSFYYYNSRTELAGIKIGTFNGNSVKYISHLTNQNLVSSIREGGYLNHNNMDGFMYIGKSKVGNNDDYYSMELKCRILDTKNDYRYIRTDNPMRGTSYETFNGEETIIKDYTKYKDDLSNFSREEQEFIMKVVDKVEYMAMHSSEEEIQKLYSSVQKIEERMKTYTGPRKDALERIILIIEVLCESPEFRELMVEEHNK